MCNVRCVRMFPFDFWSAGERGVEGSCRRSAVQVSVAAAVFMCDALNCKRTMIGMVSDIY